LYYKESTKVVETKEVRMGGGDDDDDDNNENNVKFFDAQDTEADEDYAEADEDNAETHSPAKKLVKKRKDTEDLTCNDNVKQFSSSDLFECETEAKGGKEILEGESDIVKDKTEIFDVEGLKNDSAEKINDKTKILNLRVATTSKNDAEFHRPSKKAVKKGKKLKESSGWKHSQVKLRQFSNEGEAEIYLEKLIRGEDDEDFLNSLSELKRESILYQRYLELKSEDDMKIALREQDE